MKQFKPSELSLLALCIALNSGIGFLVQLVKLPIYLDLIGSIVAIAVLGQTAGIIVAVLGVIILGVLTVPTAFAYVGTAVIVTLAGGYFMRWGYLKSLLPTVIWGAVLGVISAVVSAPVTAYLFGGVSLVGADAFTAFFRATGSNLITSVFLGGFSTDPVDKILMSLVALSVYKSLPKSIINQTK